MLKQNSGQSKDVLIRCENPECRAVQYFSPSKAKARKYCNRTCERTHRGLPTVAADVIDLLGGSRILAKRIGATQRTVISWRAAGIPTKFHFEFVKLARSDGLEEDITFEVLQRTTTEGRAFRAVNQENNHA